MTVQLSSLRVSAEMDAGAYTRGMAQKVAADKEGAASAKAVGTALGQLDAAAKATGDAAAKLSKQWIEGYSAAARFEKVVRDIGNAVDTGMSLERASVQLDNVYRKFGLVADATVLAQQGFVSIAPVVEQLNQHYAEQNRLLAEQAAAAERAAAAAKAQAELEARVKAYTAAVDPMAVAQERYNAALFEAEDLYTAGVISVEQYRMGLTKAQSALDATAAAARKAADAVAEQSQAWINSALGIRDDFGSERRAADIAAWAKELDRYHAELVQVREEEQRIARERRAANQTQINGLLGVRAPSSDTDYSARAGDIEAFGRSIDALRVKYDPLYAAEEKHAEAVADINRLYAMGEVTQDRYTEILRRANSAHEASVKSVNSSTVAVGLAGHQWQNLGYQINDVVTMLLSGSSPFQVIATQGGQVVQILQSGQGGVVGSLRSVGAAVLALLTPINLAIAGFAGLGVAATVSWMSWQSGQAEIQRSLLGIGRASGATVGQINAIAEAYAGLGKVSTSTARDIAASLAATGQVSPDLFGDAIASAKDFGKVLGVDTPEAAKQLAQALADPAKGAEQLNRVLGAFDAATMKRIQSLDAQNRLSEAQRQIIEGVKNATKGAEQATTGWSRTWDELGASLSNTWDALGKWIDEKAGNAPLEQQLKQMEAQREAQEKVLDQIRGSFIYSFRAPEAESALDDLKKRIQAAKDELDKGAAKAREMREALASLRMMGTINIVMPELNIRQQMEDRALALAVFASNSQAQAAQGISQEQATLAARRANEAANTYLTTQEAAVKQLDLQNRAITARSVAEKASIAAEQKRLELAGANIGPDEKAVLIEKARANALKEGAFALSEQARERLRTANDSIETSRLELQLVGATAEERERVLTNLKMEQDLRAEAARNGTAVDQAQLEILKLKNAEQAKQNQLLRDAKLIDDAMFERSQLGRSETDQQIASALRSAGQPVNFDSYEAGLMRVNAQLKDFKEMSSTALSGFASDIMNGVSALDAFSNALTRIADKLIQMASDQLVAQAFGGLLGSGGFGGASLGTVGSTTGASYGMTTGIFHTGGIIGAEMPAFRFDHPGLYANAPRFHSGTDPFGLLAGEKRAILKDDEGVFTPHQMRALGARMQDSIAMSFSPSFQIDASGSAMSPAQMQQVMLTTISSWWRSARQEVVTIVQGARRDGIPGL